MKLLFDLFPVILFFIAYKAVDVYAATWVAIAATIGQIVWLKLRGHRVEPMQWASLVLITLFGGMTLLFHDEAFIKVKPTVLYALFAVILLAAERVTGRNPLRAMMGGQFDVPAAIWQRLTWLWAGFFISMAVLNSYVANNYPLDTWVNFKLFGTLGLTLIFVIAQGVWLSRHIKAPE
jgi:intracellular septation protein